MFRINLGILLVGLLLIDFSGVSADEIPLSGRCGYMCHIAMANQGGSGAMAYQGLLPVEGDISQMKARFEITLAQEAAWKKFEQVAIRPMPDPHQSMDSGTPQTSAERAKFMEELWHQRYEHMQAITGAYKDLYEVLSPKQKLIADRRFGYCELTR